MGGSSIDRIISVESIEFGGARFENVPVLVPIEALGAFNTTRIQANLGTAIFSRFRMIVDFARSRLILEPAVDASTRPFARNRAGVFFERTSGGFEVVHVSDGSPALEAGMRAGDIVTEIDGQAVEEDYWTGELWRWSAAPAGTDVVVQVASGRTFTLTLRDYY